MQKFDVVYNISKQQKIASIGTGLFPVPFFVSYIMSEVKTASFLMRLYCILSGMFDGSIIILSRA